MPKLLFISLGFFSLFVKYHIFTPFIVNSSPDPCDIMHHGKAPNSEPETRNIVDFLLPQSPAFIAYMSYHSYGQRFFTRWDYTNQVPEDHEELVCYDVLMHYNDRML